MPNAGRHPISTFRLGTVLTTMANFTSQPFSSDEVTSAKVMSGDMSDMYTPIL